MPTTPDFDPSRRVPLAEIRLKNFKSVTEATVALRPITVIVGQNSSGKSTLLQSVLALAQSVRNESGSAQFPLNGELVRLGTFAEVRNFQAKPDAEVAIGFTMGADIRTVSQQTGRAQSRRVRVSWDGHLAAPHDVSSGFARLDAIEFSMEVPTAELGTAQVSLDIGEIDGELEAARTPFEYAPRFGRFSDTRLSVSGRLTDLRSGTTSKIDALEVIGGLPAAAFREETRFNLLARVWWDAYSAALGDALEEQKVKWAEAIQESDQRRPSAVAVKRASEDLGRVSEEGGGLGGTQLRARMMGRARPEYQMFFEQALMLRGAKRSGVARSMVGLGEASFRQRLRRELRSSEWLDTTVFDEAGGEVRDELFQVTRSAGGLFKEIRYLGPLRESPQVLYNPASTHDLGVRGEYSAAVLHARGRRVVRVPLPGGRQERVTLSQALNLWLAELGLADGATATDRGRLGIGLTVSPVGSNREVDLTSVGVGVSQALPVVLLCLLAEPGTVILLEQPELHLHPAMQLRLADFLLACAKSGRQIIVESHSEHLVNRLRYHVAADDTDRTGRLVRLLFAEQEDGATTYRPSDVNALGGLSEDWPRGFLDVASEEAALFLRQTLAKKRSTSQRID